MACHGIASIGPIVLLAIATPALSAQDSGNAAAVIATVDAALNAAQTGDLKTLHDQYAADCVIIDEFAPFRWRGATALDNYAASAFQMYRDSQHTDVKMSVSPPTYVYVSGDNAYLVEPVSEQAMVKGTPYSSTGYLSFTLARTGDAWKITSQTWTKAGENRNPY